jgi:hypothetical protein
MISQAVSVTKVKRLTSAHWKKGEVSILFCFALLMALMEAMAMGEPQLFVVPKGGKIAVWEAEQAKSDGWIVVRHEWASGGAFVEPVEGHARPALEFPFRTDRPITLQVFPLWWWHGEQKTATRFPSYLPYFRLPQIFEMAYPDPKGVTRLPFPVPARFGPDALDGDGKRLFFTAPEAGRIGVLDLTTERLVQVLEIGGYPTDLLVDRQHRCVYVADGLGNRIVALDAETGAKLREVGVSPMPYSLAQDGQHLFVACLMAKELVILETPSLHLVRRLPLPIGAHHVEVREGKVVVWLAPTAYDAKALTEDVPDRLAFYPLHVFPENIYEPPMVWQTLRALRKGGVVRLFARAPNFGSLWDGRFHVEPQTAVVQAGEQPTQLQIRWMLNPPRETLLDIAALGLRVDDENALPDRYCVAGGKFFFTLPSLGKVVCHPLSPDAEPIVLDIGGFLSDMTAFSDGFWVGYRGFGYMPTGQPPTEGEPFGIPLGKYVDACLSFFPSPDLGRVYSPEHRRFPPKVYIADAQNHRVVVLDPQTLHHIKSIAVSEEPIALSLFGLEGDDGGLLLERLFFKLPKLTHPRLLCRAEMLPTIRERVAAHRQLFQRWRQWLERHVDDPDFLPSNWTGTGQNLGVELAKWRAIACLFAEWAVPRDDGQRPLLQKVLPLLKGRASAGAWSSFQGDFQFGGALAVLYDFAIALEPSFALKVREQLRPSLLLERALPETLLLMDEPLTPTMRMVLRRHAVILDNYLRYFQAHQGKTGGMLWQGLGTHCQCALHSIARSLLFWGNFLADLSFLQDAFGKLYAHINYPLPRYDHEGFLAKGGMKGDHPGTPGIDPKVGTLPMRWLLAHLCGEPMELASLNLTPMIRQLETATDEEAMRLFSDGANFVVPMWLALGIVDLKATKKRWDELPMSRCFEAEGTACLKSDWSPTMTDIYFVSGVRDVAYRTQPNHLQIFKAGRVLFGTPVHIVDHGTPTPSWANAVVIGEGLPKEWAIAMGYGRMSERIIVNRFAPEVLGYAVRDFRLKGIEPESYLGWFAGGHAGPGTYDLTLHSHTRHPFLSQGAIIAFASQPDWDYVAGDATNVWRVDEVREVYRQVVFVRPDFLIVFDRLQLRQPRLTQWLASTAPDVRIDKNTFVVTNKEAFLWGIVLSPERAKLQVDGVQNLPGGRKQNRLRIVPDGLPLSVNYLVVLRTGIGTPTPLSVQLVRESEMVGVKVPLDGQTVTALFRTEGFVGGKVRLERNGQRQVFPIPKPVGCAKMQAVR